MSNDLFSDKNIQAPNEDNHQEIDFVEEAKKKFNKDGELDIQELAKGKVLADRHIETLEQKLDALSAKVNEQATVEQFMDRLNQL